MKKKDLKICKIKKDKKEKKPGKIKFHCRNFKERGIIKTLSEQRS